jgi:lysophospholipase L1-like esterase
MRIRTLIAAAAVLAAGPTTTTAAPACIPGGPWTSTWNSALDHGQSVGPWQNQTLRMVAHVSAGGTQLRIHLSNTFASSPAPFTHVSVAPQLNQARAADAPTVVTFGGGTAVTLAPGATAVSDPVSFPTVPGERLLVSLYIPAGANVASANLHTYSGETEYNIVGSDATTETNPGVSNTFGFTSYLDGVDVDATSAQTVVVVGDSITDLGGSPTDADARWPDHLGRRTQLAVIDQGISGNWVTADQGNGGPSLQNRWQRDVLTQTGVRTVIDADGINDMRGGVSAAALESAQATLIASAHSAGLRVVLATITPCAGASLCGGAFETQRQAYNAWVRAGSSGADSVADFDAAVSSGTSLAGIYDPGDHLHPNAAGMLSLAQAIDTTKL